MRKNFLDGGERVSSVNFGIGLGSRDPPWECEPSDGPQNRQHDAQDEGDARPA